VSAVRELGSCGCAQSGVRGVCWCAACAGARRVLVGVLVGGRWRAHAMLADGARPRPKSLPSVWSQDVRTGGTRRRESARANLMTRRETRQGEGAGWGWLEAALSQT
jgi:hypothetical protein